METPSIKKNFTLSTMYQILTMITPFITAPYVSRVLGPDGIGIYSYTSSIQMYFAMFAALGTVTYGGREIARVRNDEKKRSVLFWEIELLTVITTVACLVLWGIFIFIQGQYHLYYLILTFNIVAVLFDISWFYTGIEKFEHIVLQNSIFKILSIVCIFAFVKTQGDLPIYVAIMALSVALGNLSMWIYLPRYLTKIDIKCINIKPHFKETLVYFIPTVATSIYTVLDKTLIGVITKDSSENGYYEQATKIINMAKAVAFVALNNVLMSRISYLFAEKKFDEIKIRTNQSLSYIFFIGIGLTFGIIGTAPRFVPCFFGTGYDNVITLLWILSPVIIIIGVSNCLGSHYYTPAGLRALSAKYLIVGSVVNLILNCLFIPRFKSYGAAVATIIAELVITILYVANCKGFVSLRDLWKNFWKRLIAGCVMMIAIFGISQPIKSDLFAVIVDFIIGVAIYVIVLAVLKDEFVLAAIVKTKHKFIKTKPQ